MRKKRNCILIIGLSVIAFLFISCASRSKINFKTPGKYGFITEMDEPSTRGKLSMISPPDMYIKWNYSFSPDGKSVVFSGKQVGSNEPYQLYRLDIGSKTPVKITSGGEKSAWDPSFTSDGKFIVYRTVNDFWKIRKDGSGAKVKIQGSGLNRDYFPCVSSTNKVAFITYDRLSGKYLIWTIGLDGSELTQFREGNNPRWSPDGSKIVFEYQEDIWMMNHDGTILTQLTSTENITESLPSFSPDGNYIIYVSNESGSGKASYDVNIWYIGLDGRNKTQVTDLKSWDSWPNWTNDGIYFLSGRAKGDKRVVRLWCIKMSEFEFSQTGQEPSAKQ